MWKNASASMDYTIKIWDLNTNKSIYTLKEHSGSVNSVIQLQDGRIASASFDKSIRIWDLKL